MRPSHTITHTHSAGSVSLENTDKGFSLLSLLSLPSLTCLCQWPPGAVQGPISSEEFLWEPLFVLAGVVVKDLHHPPHKEGRGSLLRANSLLLLLPNSPPRSSWVGFGDRLDGRVETRTVPWWWPFSLERVVLNAPWFSAGGLSSRFLSRSQLNSNYSKFPGCDQEFLEKKKKEFQVQTYLGTTKWNRVKHFFLDATFVWNSNMLIWMADYKGRIQYTGIPKLWLWNTILRLS